MEGNCLSDTAAKTFLDRMTMNDELMITKLDLGDNKISEKLLVCRPHVSLY